MRGQQTLEKMPNVTSEKSKDETEIPFHTPWQKLGVSEEPTFREVGKKQVSVWKVNLYNYTGRQLAIFFFFNFLSLASGHVGSQFPIVAVI